VLTKILFPVLQNYPLQSTKHLDFLDFFKAVKYKPTRLHEKDVLYWKTVMSGMNSGRTKENIQIQNISKFWLLGFIEGEGTFGFKNLVPYFQVGQHTKNNHVLYAIKSYLETLNNGFRFTLQSNPPMVSKSLHFRTSVSVLSVQDIDALHDYIAFFFLDMPFQSRKKIDFLY
jgi:hypothetical protein